MSGWPGWATWALAGRRRRHAVTGEGVQEARPGREAVTGAGPRRRRAGRRGEQPMVPSAEFTSYYGKPVIKSPVWESPDIPGYLFLGGLAGAASLLGAGAQLTGRPGLATAAKTSAFGAGCLSVAALIHDLGGPARFLHMLRVVKVTSPMNVGSWLLGGYVPAAGVAAVSALTGRLPRLGAAATTGSALLGPAVAAYTAALISDTAVPAWHDGYPEMPFVFTGSASADDPKYTVIPQRQRIGAWQAEAVPLPDNRGPGWIARSAGTGRGENHKVATSHDPRGAGRPRLIVALGGLAPEAARPREFDLDPGVTIIGSGPDTDVRLEGLEPRHAEIRHDEQDEYVYINRGTGSPGRVDGQPVSQKPLRTGDRIEIGDWTLSYVREEFADHGKLEPPPADST